MTRPQRPEQESGYQDNNGLAREARDTGEQGREATQEATARFRQMRPAYQGYLLLAVGTLLFLFSIGLLPILRWVIVAASVGLIIWGAMRANLFQQVNDYFQRMNRKKNR